MPQIEIIIRDDDGNILNSTTRRVYSLSLESGTFSEIEGAVDSLKNELLPSLECDLLSQQQCQSISEIKKKSQVKCNGTYEIDLKSLHGKFRFPVQRFSGNEGRTFTYFDYTNQFQDSYESERLQEYVCYSANRQSYQGVENSLVRMTGSKLLSDQQIREIVLGKAHEVSQKQSQAVKKVLESSPPLPEINTTIDLYDPNIPEVLLSYDGIGVKRQKEKRKRSKDESYPSAQKETDKKRSTRRTKEPVKVNSDVILLEKADASFSYLMTGLSTTLTLEELLKSQIISEYGDSKKALNVVAITDGAKNIRRFFKSLFGQEFTPILDWYHLRKRTCELFTMISRNKLEKEQQRSFVLHQLWKGNISVAIDYLETKVIPKNQNKLEELITYLKKHSPEIINYEARQNAGKAIGSGRMEKALDLIIGHRQKKKGMSWGNMGSRALAILKTVELNQLWNQLWNFDTQVA